VRRETHHIFAGGVLTQTETIPPAAAGNITRAAQYSTFYVDSSFFGVDVLDVQEVLRYQEMTRVPLAASTVEGLINLRGQIVTAIDMRRRLGLHARPEGMDPMNVVIRSDDGAVSLLVDQIGDVIDAAADCHEAVPENIPENRRSILSCVVKLDRQLLLVLDTKKLLQAAERE
jgi:purine-binding chemotaxis protein CheW